MSGSTCINHICNSSDHPDKIVGNGWKIIQEFQIPEPFKKPKSHENQLHYFLEKEFNIIQVLQKKTSREHAVSPQGVFNFSLTFQAGILTRIGRFKLCPGNLKVQNS